MADQTLVVRIRKDLSGLDRFESRVPKNVKYAVHDAAIALREDIRSSWSPTAPSAPNSPPAVVEGNLDKSVVVDSTGRDAAGRFASDKDAVTQFVRIDISASGFEGPGSELYPIFLEEGTSKMTERPYFAPAVERMEAMYPQFFGNIFRRVIGGGGDDGEGDE